VLKELSVSVMPSTAFVSDVWPLSPLSKKKVVGAAWAELAEAMIAARPKVAKDLFMKRD
jgi:hypothetical protein